MEWAAKRVGDPRDVTGFADRLGYVTAPTAASRRVEIAQDAVVPDEGADIFKGRDKALPTDYLTAAVHGGHEREEAGVRVVRGFGRECPQVLQHTVAPDDRMLGAADSHHPGDISPGIDRCR